MLEPTAQFDPYSAPASAIDGKPPAAPSAPGGKRHTPAMVDLLRRTRPWVLFIAIMGFIGTGLMVLAGLVMVVVGAVGGSGDAPAVAGMGVVYVVLSGVYFLFAFLLVRYSGAIRRLAENDATEELEDALDAQRLFWKASGIMVIVMMSVAILALMVGLAIGLSQAF